MIIFCIFLYAEIFAIQNTPNHMSKQVWPTQPGLAKTLPILPNLSSYKQSEVSAWMTSQH